MNAQKIMKRTTIVLFGLLLFAQLPAQQFVNKGIIEYEVKTNIKKTLGNSQWAEMMKDNMPNFKTGYFHLIFSGNKSVYKFNRWDEKDRVPDFMRKGDEENSWYFDHDKGSYNMQKNVFGSYFNVEDSIPEIKWRLMNENRLIAGYNCRKAVGKILDSVYVFAFYTDEITLSGGPCSINGLPGTVLGLTIPRMYTSWIATKVITTGVPEKEIVPVVAKKYYTTKNLKSAIHDRVKEWGNEDDPESRKWIDQLYWSVSL